VYRLPTRCGVFACIWEGSLAHKCRGHAGHDCYGLCHGEADSRICDDLGHAVKHNISSRTSATVYQQRGKHDLSACLLQACWHEKPDHRPGFESITGSLRLLFHQTAALGSRADRLTGMTTAWTASGSPPKPARMPFDISLLSSHHVPVHTKPQALAAAPAALRTSPHPAESVRGLASAFSVTSGSQGKLSPAEHLHNPERMHSPFQGLSVELKSVSEALPMVTSQSQLTASSTAPPANSFQTRACSLGWCPTLP